MILILILLVALAAATYLAVQQRLVVLKLQKERDMSERVRELQKKSLMAQDSHNLRNVNRIHDLLNAKVDLEKQLSDAHKLLEMVVLYQDREVISSGT